MIILGIESTAHTLGIGIIKVEEDKEGKTRKKILANVKDAYTTEHGGIIPVKAAEHHKRIKDELLKTALKDAGIKIKDIDVIAFSQGPGLGPCLRVGARFAAKLSYENKTPIVGVNHCIAHLEVASLVSDVKDPVLLYVSGANTQVIAYESGKYRIFGETLDMGVGNFLDAFARSLGIGFPGGPVVYKLSLKGKRFVELPYVVKGMDISVSGLLTNLKDKIKKISEKKVDYTANDLCFSVQETVFSMLLEVTERAIFHCNKKEVVLGGGVGCNKRLQEMVRIMGKEDKIKVFIPDNSLLTDNGVMIAWLGYKMFSAHASTKMNKTNTKVKIKEKNKKKFMAIQTEEEALNIGIRPYQRTDEVDVYWK